MTSNLLLSDSKLENQTGSFLSSVFKTPTYSHNYTNRQTTEMAMISQQMTSTASTVSII